MTTNSKPTDNVPLSLEQLARIQDATQDFSPLQLAWASGYFWGLLGRQSAPPISTPITQPAQLQPEPVITIISASQTGNARKVAEALQDDLHASGLKTNLVRAGEYKFKQIATEKFLVVVTSTQGAGDPPEEAIPLHKFLFSKKAPQLKDTAFAVLGLGDSSYEFFCQAGKDFDTRLEELGATRLLVRTDADVDFQAVATEWRSGLVELLKTKVSVAVAPISADTVLAFDPVPPAPIFTREAPLLASVAVQQKITGRNSAKDVRHIEIDLGESGLLYQPGDALGVWYENDAALVKEILGYLELDAEQPVVVEEQTLPLGMALQRHFELTVNTPVIVKAYAELSKDEVLTKLVAEQSALQNYVASTPIVDMLRQHSTKLTVEQLLGFLRPLTPRLYSIASAQSEVGNEVHITVGVVRYEIDNHIRSGGASGYLADHAVEDAVLRVFVEPNEQFRLPADPSTPIIMIGAGTGIAPFRAFLQERASAEASGKNWLFFGNPHFTEDFLYQVEWQSYVKDGILTHVDLAWSRDQSEKIYVQHKLRAQADELWQWLEQGACLYVCGDIRMAQEVEAALLDVIVAAGTGDIDAAEDYLNDLRMEHRYQRDVY